MRKFHELSYTNINKAIKVEFKNHSLMALNG